MRRGGGGGRSPLSSPSNKSLFENVIIRKRKKTGNNAYHDAFTNGPADYCVHCVQHRTINKLYIARCLRIYMYTCNVVLFRTATETKLNKN